MTDFTSKIRVIATAAVTWLVVISGVITAILPVVGDEWPEVVPYGLTAVAWIGTAVAIIRTVSPVAPDERGILPSE